MPRRVKLAVLSFGLMGVLAGCGGARVTGVTVSPDPVVPGQAAKACADISWGGSDEGIWSLKVSRVDPSAAEVATAQGEQGIEACVNFVAPTPGSYQVATYVSSEFGEPDFKDFPFFVPDPGAWSGGAVVSPLAGASPVEGAGPVIVGVTVEPAR